MFLFAGAARNSSDMFMICGAVVFSSSDRKRLCAEFICFSSCSRLVGLLLWLAEPKRLDIFLVTRLRMLTTSTLSTDWAKLLKRLISSKS